MAAPGHITVCVVDDDPDIRESLRFLLEEVGYEVEEAVDGAAALALLRADARPRVLLLDRMMPRFDGVQTLRALDAEPDLPRRTAVIFMTAHRDPPTSDFAPLLDRVTMTTLGKPFDLDDVLAKIAHASRWLAERDPGE